MAKFSDYRSFITSDTCARVEVELSYAVKHIEDALGNGLQLQPDFQRNRVWSKDEQIAYLEYLISGGESGRVIYFNDPYHMGWKESYAANEYHDYVVVDGLQRLTAVLAFYSNEIPVFGHFFNEFEDKPRRVYLEFRTNSLKTKADVLKWYIQLNTTGKAHTPEEIEKVKNLLKEEE